MFRQEKREEEEELRANREEDDDLRANREEDDDLRANREDCDYAYGDYLIQFAL